MSSVSTKLDQPASQGPMGQVRGSRIGQGCRVGRGAMMVLRIFTKVHVLLNLESVVYVLH